MVTTMDKVEIAELHNLIEEYMPFEQFEALIHCLETRGEITEFVNSIHLLSDIGNMDEIIDLVETKSTECGCYW